MYQYLKGYSWHGNAIRIHLIAILEELCTLNYVANYYCIQLMFTYKIRVCKY